MSESFSVLVLTLNEELTLGDCLDSLGKDRDVVVLDSGSTDRTKEIAFSHGARFETRPFTNYADQRNFGLNALQYENDWILMLDADERLTPEFVQEVENRLAVSDSATTLFRLRRKDFFMGRWLRHSSGYPTWFGRLLKRGHARVVREINEEYETTGNIEYLEEHILHFPFAKGITHWLEKHNHYSSLEAKLLETEDVESWHLKSLLSRDPVTRRKAQKYYMYRLPGRPGLIFFAFYFLRRGFLDGRPGLQFCLLRAYYEFMISCKRLELRRIVRGEREGM